jgi:hypothetical protein
MVVYRHTKDIDKTKDYTGEEADSKLIPAVDRTIGVLRNDTDLDPNFRHLGVRLLEVFLSTHRSIVLLLGKEDEDPLLGADALSLAREQVEKVFAVSLLSEDPSSAKTYLMDSWRRMFERYLLEREERQGISPEHQAFYQQAFGRIEAVRKRLGIPDEVRDLVEYRFFNPKDPKGGPPPHVVGVKKPEEFPSPSGVVGKISAPRKPFLERWYREYRFFCDFTYCGMGKLELAHLFDPRSGYTSYAKAEYYGKEVQNAAAASLVAAASATTELATVLDAADGERLSGLLEYWEWLRPRFLIAQAMWDLRAKDVMPHMLGT